MKKAFLVVLTLAVVAVPAALADKPANPGTSNKPANPGTSNKGVKTVTAKLKGANGMRASVVIRLNASTDTVCWSFSSFNSLKQNGKAADAAHIHVTGNTAPFIPLGGTGANFKRRGCTTNHDWSTPIDQVIANASPGYTVNVHEAGGAVLISGALKKGAPAS